MNDLLVDIQNVSAGYNGDVVLKDISLKIYPGDFIALIGPNGGGKTTLLKVILGLLKIKKGALIKSKGLSIGYLPQYTSIDYKFPISAREVILSGYKKNPYTKKKKKEITRLNSILTDLGISNIKNKPIGELSGGQRQRVLIGRAIISEPQLLLLDEPSTYVDNKIEGEIYELLKKLNNKMAIIIVSHDVGIISSHVKTIACINQHLHYHESNELNEEILKSYNCPIDLITHGTIPHRVLKKH